MNIIENKLENATVELEIEVPVERVEIEYKSTFDKIMRTSKIDGFRKGKAPLPVVEVKYKEYADGEVADSLSENVLMDAVTDKKLVPLTRPEYTFDTIKRGEIFKFKAKFEILPTIELDTYKDISAEEKSCKVTDEDVNYEIGSIREKYAETSPKDDENDEVKLGDLVNLKLKRIDDVDDSEKDKVEYKDYSIIVGKSKDDSALDKKILGMKTGEERDVQVKYPKNYYIKDLAGQKVTYLVKIEKMQAMALPELDDELAKKENFETKDEMIQKTKEFIEKFVKEKVKSEARAQIINTVVENSTFDLPNSMVESEMGAIYSKTKQRIASQTGIPMETLEGLSMEEYASIVGVDSEEFTTKIREEAVKAVKTTLTLSEIAKKEEMKVSEEKYKEFIDKYAEGKNQKVEDVEEMIKMNNNRESIEYELLMDQSMDFLYDNAKIKMLKPISLDELVNDRAE